MGCVIFVRYSAIPDKIEMEFTLSDSEYNEEILSSKYYDKIEMESGPVLEDELEDSPIFKVWNKSSNMFRKNQNKCTISDWK